MRYAIFNGAIVHVVDTEPPELAPQNVRHFPMRAADYLASKTA